MNENSLDKAKDCAEKERIELTDEQLDEVSGAREQLPEIGARCTSCANRRSCSYSVKDTVQSKSCADYTPQESSCITPLTPVTLADGRQVAVQDLTGEEELLTWNFATGKQDKAPILLIEKKAPADYEVMDLTFSDGSAVGVVFEHGFFDVDLKKYIYLDKDAERYIGHRFEKSGKTVELVSVQKRTENTAVYSPVTYGHICCYVNGMLSITGGVNGIINYFEIDGMKYDEGKMQADIEKYGLFTYEEFSKMIPVPESIFHGLNCQYLKIAIGKGLVTLETLRKYAAIYAPLFHQAH